MNLEYIHSLWDGLKQAIQRGDILTGNANGRLTRLGKGTSGQILTSDGTDPSWSTPTTPAPVDADYLVGTTNATLTNEIVVGTTPGGELGGTWAAPTVDATHSGSAHHVAVTLGAGSDAILSLSGQELTLGDVTTEAELTTHKAADDHALYLLASDATSRAVFAANWLDLTDAGATTLHSHTGGVEVDLDATYILQTTHASLPNAQTIASLASGILLGTITTGVITSLAFPGGTSTFLRADGGFASVTAVASISTTEIDFGVVPVSEGNFIITDSNVNAASRILAQVAYVAPTDKELDEVEMDDLQIRCGPGDGQFYMYVKAADGSYLADKFQIYYQVGA